MIKHIFFDLDHTIWDFDKNAQETLNELYIQHELDGLGCGTVEEFITKYTENNHELWRQYHLGNITKETLRSERFSRTFLQLGIDPEKVSKIFEPFFTTKIRAVGLGLTHAQRILMSHNGLIKVESSEKGTLLTMQVPLDQ